MLVRTGFLVSGCLACSLSFQSLEALTLEAEALSVGDSGTAPAVRTGLQVEPNGTVWSGTGAGYESNSGTPSGEGTRLMWVQEKNAFRAGSLFVPWQDLWDYAQLGQHSFAWGVNNQASGYGATTWGALNAAGDAYTTAWGAGNTAQGYAATTWGRENLAHGDQTTAFGYYTEASGLCATSWGRDGSATGDYATSWGERSHAAAYLSTAFGRDNIGGFTENPYGPNGDTQWHDDDPLLEVGVGHLQGGQSGKANAFSIMKNGATAVGFHTAHPSGEEALVVHGALQLGDYAEPAAASPAPGALRYHNDDFEGYDGQQWHSLTAGEGAGGGSPAGAATNVLTKEGSADPVVRVDASGAIAIAPDGDFSNPAFAISSSGVITIAKQGNLSMGRFTATH